MTEPLQHKIGGGRVSPQAAGTPAASRRGWLRFAGLVATLIGASHVIAGLLAWSGSELYVVWASKPALTITSASWGWAHLVLGALLISVAVLASRPWELSALVSFVAASVLMNLVSLAAQPVWAALVIGLDVVVLHAVIVRGQRLSSPANDSQR